MMFSKTIQSGIFECFSKISDINILCAHDYEPNFLSKAEKKIWDTSLKCKKCHKIIYEKYHGFGTPSYYEVEEKMNGPI
jgi:hypothetical protein